jgi:hypothetical protein
MARQLVGKGGHGNGVMYAHRAAYELAKGPIPRGHHIHHTCGNVRCIEPAHLIAVLPKAHAAIHLAPECPNGHAFTPKNTYWRPDTGVRQCKQCRAIYMRGYYREHKADWNQP